MHVLFRGDERPRRFASSAPVSCREHGSTVICLPFALLLPALHATLGGSIVRHFSLIWSNRRGEDGLYGNPATATHLRPGAVFLPFHQTHFQRNGGSLSHRPARPPPLLPLCSTHGMAISLPLFCRARRRRSFCVFHFVGHNSFILGSDDIHRFCKNTTAKHKPNRVSSLTMNLHRMWDQG